MAKVKTKKISADLIIDPLVLDKVKEQLDLLMPIIKAHKGGVQILKATKTELLLKLEGHCADCALAPMTYGLVLDQKLKSVLPDIKIKYTS